MKENSEEGEPSALCGLKRVLKEETPHVHAKPKREANAVWHWREYLQGGRIAAPSSQISINEYVLCGGVSVYSVYSTV